MQGAWFEVIQNRKMGLISLTHLPADKHTIRDSARASLQLAMGRKRCVRSDLAGCSETVWAIASTEKALTIAAHANVASVFVLISRFSKRFSMRLP